MAGPPAAFVGYSAALADDGVLDAQPAAGGEAVIHNIWATGSAEVYVHNGANTSLLFTITGGGPLQFLCLHVTNTQYITIKNINGDAQDVGYDGIYTVIET